MTENREPSTGDLQGGAPRLIRPLLLYNGGCRFCRWAARLVDRVDRDGALAFLSILDEEAKPIVDAIPEAERYTGWHLVTLDGARLSGGIGAIVVLEQLRWTRWVGRLCRLLRLAPLLGAIDGFVSEKKGRLSHHVPEGPGPHRFP